LNKKVLIAICGAGGRGKYAYAPYVKKNPELAEIVAVADPKKENRDEIAARNIQ
jgi:predicted dehydrogenase